VTIEMFVIFVIHAYTKVIHVILTDCKSTIYQQLVSWAGLHSRTIFTSNNV